MRCGVVASYVRRRYARCPITPRERSQPDEWFEDEGDEGQGTQEGQSTQETIAAESGVPEVDTEARARAATRRAAPADVPVPDDMEDDADVVDGIEDDAVVDAEDASEDQAAHPEPEPTVAADRVGRILLAQLEVLHMSEPDAAVAALGKIVAGTSDLEALAALFGELGVLDLARDVRALADRRGRSSR
jgi:hypothetical protein